MSIVRKGPARDFEMVARVVKLRRRGYSYRRIALELGKDVKTVYRWSRYAVGSYPHEQEMAAGSVGK